VGPIGAAWEALQAIGAELGDTRAHYLVALAHARTGRQEEAFRLLFKALERVAASDEHWWEPELYRMLGELVKETGSVPPELVAGYALPASAPLCAEACLVRAVDLARGMGARSLELRAVLSLSRCWGERGKAGEAHALLSEVHGWFTEGFGTRDLIEASQLLRELERELR
jgi:predicted ATPase